MPNREQQQQALVDAMRKADQALERLTQARTDRALTMAGIRLSRSTAAEENAVAHAATIYDIACQEFVELILAAGAPPEDTTALADLDACIEEAWGVIANANGGIWESADPGWVAAAKRWADKWMPQMSARKAAAPAGRTPE